MRTRSKCRVLSIVRVVGVLVGMLAVCGFGAGEAAAAAPAPGWTIDSLAMPTNFSVEEGGEYQVTVTNAGDARATTGSLILADMLPEGVSVQSVSLHWPTLGESDIFPLFESAGDCSLKPVHCAIPLGGPVSVLPDETLTMIVHVAVESNAPRPLVNEATVSGGGAGQKIARTENRVAAGVPSFGLANFSFYASGPDGQPDTQAGDHPYEMTMTLDFNNAVRPFGPDGSDSSVEDPKDVVVDLPLGFVGSTLAAPECPMVDMGGNNCPADTIIGHILTEPCCAASVNSPIFNLVPERGVPAEFGYVDDFRGAHPFYVHVVPTPAGYVIQAISPDIPEVALTHVVVTFYGDPAGKQEELAQREGKTASALAHVPLFTNSTDCSGEDLVAKLYMDSWENPAKFNEDGTPVSLGEPQWARSESISPPVIGCNALSFTPEITAQPTTHESDKPSGLDFEIKVPQTEIVGVPGTPTMKKAVVSFPEGFTVDPSAGDGLAACSEAQIGYVGPSHLDFTPAAPSCPEASKIGSLELESPLIPHKLEGEMYLANQNENPFGSTIGLYVVVDDPITGVLIKIPGKAAMDPHTGRLTSEFDENPNLPFSDLKLHFFGGPRAEFATPESCGTFTTSTELFPYSFSDSGPLPASPFDEFTIDEACPGGFSPTFNALSTNVQAGAFTPFVTSFSRSDADQELAGLSLTLPQGLSGKLAGIPLCPEAEANAGTCPESSLIGIVKAGSGPGPNPLFVSGKAYLTGPYNGGPFGLSVVVPAVAGPFNFGTVVVRQSIRINPLTAQVTDVSDAFPKIIDGIPLRLRRIDVELNRPGFVFNPTSCARMGFNATISGSPLGAPTELHGSVGYATEAGSTSQLSAPFQVTDCQALKFTPSFKPTVTGKTSKADGAGLSVKLSYPANSMGTQANIAHVKVELPKALPSRLTTLQQACLAATFEANPASCPTHSLVGHAKVLTPVLTDPLEGPVYFVSHGSEEFPNLTILLKGDGVSVELVGSTFISKSGITSTTFKATPDVPFSSFELTLPQGPYSALGANANLCEAKGLAMPVEFIAQNGAELKQSTPIEVSGCSSKLALVSHKRKGQRLLLSVYAPAQGKVKVSGKGIRGTSKNAKGRELISLSVPLSRAGHFKMKLELMFTPSRGAHRAEGLSLRLRT